MTQTINHWLICWLPSTLVLLAVVGFGCASSGRSAETTDSPIVYTGGVVAADHPIGSQAGARMLGLGGNAVDAAVATSFMQAVVRPYSCGLGGGGFMLVRLSRPDVKPIDKEDDVQAASHLISLVYREVAPGAVGPDFFVKLGIENASRYGSYASGVPGTVAGLFSALDMYGSLDRTTILAPAIRVAERGFVADAHYTAAAMKTVERLKSQPEIRERMGEDGYEFFMRTFLSDGNPQEGDLIVQPELARTLRLFAKYGESVFYTGEIADAIIAQCPQMSLYDLERYSVDRVPAIEGNAFGFRFITMPPPSSGGVAIQQILGFLEEHWEDTHPSSPFDPEYAHLLVEGMKHAFADRAEWMADTRFSEVPIDRLMSDEYIASLAQQFDPAHTLDSESYGSRRNAVPVDGGTSHISVIDRWGNAVACTETINLEFGSLVVLPEYGIVMNNEMDDFLTQPGMPNAFGLTQSDRNLPEPGKRPLSSMSPTIVLDSDGRVLVVAGASGGPRIITGTLQAILNTLIFQMDARDAVTAPRLHHQWMPDAVYFEDDWYRDDVVTSLDERGHEIRRRKGIGDVQLITRTADGLGYTAASDPRKGGAPAGIQ